MTLMTASKESLNVRQKPYILPKPTSSGGDSAAHNKDDCEPRG